jgi:hypothetical protein
MKNLMVRKHTFTRFTSRLVAIALFAALLSVAPFHAALAQTGTDLASFAVLGGTAVTLTGSAVIGNVGSPVAVTVTGGTVAGTVYPAGDPIAVAAYNAAFVTSGENLYDELASNACGMYFTAADTLSGVTLVPGVYCFPAAATLSGTLTLDGPSDGIWIFKIGTGGKGALTGTGFSVVMAGGGSPCNVYWWVADAATLTDSNFVGTILAGAAITTTRGTFNGQALAQAAVTMTGTAVAVCSSPELPPIPPLDEGACKKCKACSDYWNNYWNEYWSDYWKDHCNDNCNHHDNDNCNHHDNDKKHCNQGVGNGHEDCDPGNSNQHNPSNDERGGKPGKPGRSNR